MTESDSHERRAYTRHAMWFPVTLTVGSREVWSICRDVSATGLLVSSMASLDIGALVTASFRIRRDDPAEHRTRGRVVRCDASADDLQLAFPFRMAIAFDHAQAKLEDNARDFPT